MKIRNVTPGLSALPMLVLGLAVIAGGADSVCGATLKVPGSYATIQAAIDAASSGDTIKIAKGRYTENIVIDKRLTIRGKKYKTRIESANDAAPVVTITADNVELKQLDTRGGSFGIAAENVRGVKLQTVRVRDAQADGIFLRNAEKVFLNKCKSYNNGAHGILLKQNDLGAGNVIKKCRVYDNSGYGVMLEQAPGTRVESCRIYDNDRVGIYGDHAVRSLKILKNRVWGHSEIGIRFGYESYDHLVEGNVCSNNGVGIDLSGSAGVARRNVCEKNEVGFFIGMSAWLVESNKAKKNTSHGFELDDNVEGSDNSLAKNESTDNGGSGFRILSGTSEGLYRDNLARGNAHHGFHITPFGGSRGAIFDDNQAISNGGDGFRLTADSVGHSISPTTLFTDNFADNNVGFGFVNHVANVNVIYDGNQCGNNAAGSSSPAGLCD